MYRILLVAFLILTGLSTCRTPMHITGLDAHELDIDPDTRNEAMAQYIAPYTEQLAEEMGRVLCLNARDMVRARPESAIGNFISDACLLRATQDMNANVDAAMFNYGGIRSAMAEGEIKVGDIFQLMPFDNELVVVELPYAQVLAMLNYLASTGGEPVSSIELVMKEGEVLSAMIGGSPVVDRNYRILTSDYLANGGDNMVFFTEGHRISITTLGLKVRDALLTTCEELGAQGRSIDYHTEGRINEAE